MGALDIPPHSRSASRLGVTALGLIAAFALTSGYLKQVTATAPAPISADGAGPMAAIAEATPAPEPMLQVAEAPVRHVQAVEEAPVDVSEAVAPAADAPAAASVGAAEASASAPDAPPPAAPAEPPAPNDAPTT